MLDELIIQPVNVQLVVDNLGDGLSVCGRARQSAVDLVMERRQFVHHSVHHRFAVQGDEERESCYLREHLNAPREQKSPDNRI